MSNIVLFGATSAIAEATARQLAEQGHRLALVGRRQDALDAIAADLSARGAETAVFLASLDDLDAHAPLLARIKDEFGDTDIALLAWGTLPDQAACEQDTALMLREFQNNGTSGIALMSRLADDFAARQDGHLLVIGSPAGDRGRKSNYVYGAAKGALALFADGLRHRLADQGVKVTIIKPGFVDTPMTAAFDKGGPLWATPERIARDIVKAMAGNPRNVYSPWFWRPIMRIIREVPDFVFRRTNL